MDNQAYIRDLYSLEQLKISILRFCEESFSEFFVIDSKLQTRHDYLKSLDFRFHRRIESARDELNAALSSLSLCESQYTVDEDGNSVEPDCGFERSAIISCQRELRNWQNKYDIFKTQLSNLESAIGQFQRFKVKFKSFVQYEREAAVGCLIQLINGAEDYLSVSASFYGIDSGINLNMTETVAKMDPTMIVATSVGIAELLIMGVFSFMGFGGELFYVSNKSQGEIIDTTIFENGTPFVCSQLKIEKNEEGTSGKIVNIEIPPSLGKEKIGKHLVSNMEIISKVNGCEEIFGWVNSNNLEFFRNLGYQIRNEIQGSGAEIFKPLKSDYLLFQQKAKAVCQEHSGSGHKGRNIGKQFVNPLNVISPKVDYDEKFWKQHGEDQNRYVELIEKYEQCTESLNNGKSLDQIRKEDFWMANAFDIFHSHSEPIKLTKKGDSYTVDGGQHRIAAAQIYYLLTGKIVTVPADVYEIDLS